MQIGELGSTEIVRKEAKVSRPRKVPEKIETVVEVAATDWSRLKSEVVADFISGKLVRATAEETESVQVLSRRLVEDYGYPKSAIATHPQYRVRKSPSDESKTFPVDIAVFSSPNQLEDDLFLIAECKAKTRKVGIAQLKLYMDMSAATVGIWFNGDEHEYLWKVFRNGGRTYEQIPNIPKFGERVEDVGLYKRKDLVKPSNLKAVFRDIRNHLAGMATGVTRDEPLAAEIINILFCKIYDEQQTEPDEMVSFRAGVGEAADDVKDRILSIFARVKSEVFQEVFDGSEAIRLDAESIVYVVGELQTYSIMAADRDAIGDAFELFIGPALRGADGQFFTPRNVVKLIVDAVNPKPGDKIIDPACGSGGFLISAIECVWGHLKAEGKRKGWTERQLTKREVEVASDGFRGLEKDGFLAKVCKAYMALIGDGRGGVFCANSLNRPSEWPTGAKAKIKLGQFNVVLTNPPFGAKIIVKGGATLSQYDLAYKWKRNTDTGEWEKTDVLPDDRPPQILFLERCFQLLRPGGKLGIVLPESVLGNPSYAHVIAYLLKRCYIRMIATMPESLFKTSGKGGTHTKVCVLVLENTAPAAPYDIFMADAKWCGHDSRGNPTLRETKGVWALLDDVPVISARYQKFVTGKSFPKDQLGFLLNSRKVKNGILVPKYYNPTIQDELAKLATTHTLVSVESLVEQKAISLSTGVEIGKMAYGTGKIPFVRTSDISNWEIKADFKHGVSKEIYIKHRGGADVVAGDILMVRDGTYLIGTSAIVTQSDCPMLFQSHIIRIRVLNADAVSPWLLFACLNSPIVKKQIRAKQFTQDIIDTLGKRLLEVKLPIPKDPDFCAKIAKEVEQVIGTRSKLRNRSKEIVLELEGIESVGDDDILDII